MTKKVKAKQKKKNIPLAVAHIQATLNNTIVTFTDSQGNAIASSSAGANNFKGAKKSTPYAAQVTVNKAALAAKEHGVVTVSINIKGIGMQRDAAIRALFNSDARLIVTSINDVSAIPHNGARAPKKRRP